MSASVPLILDNVFGSTWFELRRVQLNLTEIFVIFLGLPRALIQTLTCSPLNITFSIHSMVYNFGSRNRVGKQESV
jgi:hypothetical protein